MTTPGEAQQGQNYCRSLTVAHIREPDATGSIDVAFLESARFYRLLRTNASYTEILKNLEHAKKEKRALNISTASIQSDIIEDVS